MHHSGEPHLLFSIRAASDADAADIAALQEAAGTDAGRRDAPGPRSAGDIRAFLAGEKSGAFVAMVDGAAAGTVSLAIDGGVARLFGLAVDARSRRHGIGGALVAAVEREARARAAFVVHVQGGMPAKTVAWFQSAGYDVDRSEPDVVLGEALETIDLIKVL